MQNRQRDNNDKTTTVSQQSVGNIQNNVKITENTSLSPNNNQTYFADERVRIPEVENVCICFYCFFNTSITLTFSFNYICDIKYIYCNYIF